MTGHLKIDPEFEKVIPPLSEDEFKQLEENILSEGEIFTPLFVWNEVIIDGHHRYKIICSHPDIKYRVLEKEFANRYEAIAWICNNQLGRRNLTDVQRENVIGRRYKAEIGSKGAADGFRGNQYAVLVKGQNDPLPKFQTTADKLAEELGVSSASVKRAGRFVNGLDAAEEVLPGISEEILSGKIKPSKKDVVAIGKVAAESRKALAQKLREPKKAVLTKSNDSPEGNSQKTSSVEDKRRIYQSIDAISANLEKPKEAISIDEVFDIIRGANRTYMETCDYYYEKYPELLAETGYKTTTLEVISELKKYIIEVEGEKANEEN